MEATVGQYADYLDTGVWSTENGHVVAPDDLTIPQLKDFLVVNGGAAYLQKDDKIVWIPGVSR
jgi:hypothetical protein